MSRSRVEMNDLQSTLKIDIAESANSKLYDEVSKLPDAGVYHSEYWHRVLEKAFGWAVNLATARLADGSLVGSLPYVRRIRMGFRRINVCLPATDIVSPLSVEGYSAVVADCMAKALSPIEIHGDVKSNSFDQRAIYTRSVIDLRGISTVNELLGRFDRKSIVRRLERAADAHFESKEATSLSYYRDFGKLVNQTRRRHGAPAYPGDFFDQIFSQLHTSGIAKLYVVERNAQLITGQIFFHYGDAATSAYSASVSDRSVLRDGANQVVKWHAMQRAFDDGMTTIDMGIANADQPSLRKYKESWGATSTPLHYSFYPVGQGSLRIGQESKLGQLAKAVFRNLPMPIYCKVSPLVHKLSV